LRQDFAALAESLKRARATGHVTVTLQPRAATMSGGELDAFVQGMGLRPLGAAWVPLAREQALALVGQLLRFDLAYHSPAADAPAAAALAERFMAAFGADVLCYTNGTWLEGFQPQGRSALRGPSWTPLTNATFDAGVVCVDAQMIGIFLVEDED
jgi:hypothetical protein